jgi:hypothetical protein
VKNEPGTEILWFSPSEELRTAEAVMMKNMQAMQDGSTPRRGGARGTPPRQEAVLHREHACGGVDARDVASRRKRHPCEAPETMAPRRASPFTVRAVSRPRRSRTSGRPAQPSGYSSSR